MSGAARGDLQRAVLQARSSAGLPVVAANRQTVSDTGRIDQTVVSFNVFASLLATDGLRAALYAVLRQSDYRFISIFRFRNGKATSTVHVDREDLRVTQAAEVDDTATYCSHVRGAKGAFVTADAGVDPRTSVHPARDAVRAYCGIPIFEPDGTLLGTLCHHDVVPRDPDQLDLALLLQVSSAIAQSGLVPPYPTVGGSSTG